MAFDPKPTCYPFPEITDRHYLVVKKNDGTVFDKNYPYIDTSKPFERKRWWYRLLTVLIAFPVMRLRLGLKITGKENLKKHKEELKNGAVSVSNHVHLWDYIAVMCALYPRRPDIIAWAKNISGENGKLIRMSGGIPVPENDVRATISFTRAIQEYLEKGGWLHICAEGSMWEYYQPIRPFKKGAFYFAVKTGRPILPMAISYREPKGLWKIFYRKAMLTLNIGEPIFPDASLKKEAAIEKLTVEAHEAVCRLAGIDPKENLYPPVFHDNRRVDYYTTRYGKESNKEQA